MAGRRRSGCSGIHSGRRSFLVTDQRRSEKYTTSQGGVTYSFF
jgi:hypothetical protein